MLRVTGESVKGQYQGSIAKTNWAMCRHEIMHFKTPHAVVQFLNILQTCFKHVGCGYDLLSGRYSTLQALELVLLCTGFWEKTAALVQDQKCSDKWEAEHLRIWCPAYF